MAPIPFRLAAHNAKDEIAEISKPARNPVPHRFWESNDYANKNDCSRNNTGRCEPVIRFGQSRGIYC